MRNAIRIGSVTVGASWTRGANALFHVSRRGVIVAAVQVPCPSVGFAGRVAVGVLMLVSMPFVSLVRPAR